MKSFLEWALLLETKEEELPKSVQNAIEKAGGAVFQVGGAVRDAILGTSSKDLDVLVTGLDEEELVDILTKFGKIDQVGKSFGVIKFKPTGFDKNDDPIDIALPRVEKSTGKGHKDFVAVAGKKISLTTDLARRDFTINAIAKDLVTGKLIDPYDGQKDIKAKTIRMINPTAFVEDPLRMLRAVQFAARLGFAIEPKTLEEIKKQADKIQSVSGERVKEELDKLFAKSKKPSKGIKLLFDTGLAKHIFPELRSADYDAIDVLDKSAKAAFYALLLEQLRSCKAAAAVKTKLKGDAKLVDSVEKALDGLENTPVTDKQIIKWQVTNGSEATKVLDQVLKAKGRKNTLTKRLDSLKAAGVPLSLKDLAVDGNDLVKAGLQGKQIGNALQKLFNFVIDNPEQNKKLILMKMVANNENI